MIVHKFGGTSVGDAQCFANVADIVSERQNKKQAAVVVSAMSGVTDQLIVEPGPQPRVAARYSARSRPSC